MLDENAELVDQRILGDATLLNCQIWVDKKVVDIPTSETRSAPALHYSVFHGHYDMVELLLERGADVDSLGYENNHENTPSIVLAAWEGGIEVLELLLKCGANPNLKSSNGVSAMSTSVRHNKLKEVNMLLKYGAIEG